MNDRNASAIYAERRKKLKDLLVGCRLDALIVTDAVNRFYLSGFELHDTQCNESSGFLLITVDEADCLFTDSRYELLANSLWQGEVCIYKNNAVAALAQKLKKKATVAGFEKNTASWNFMNELQRETDAFNLLLKPVSGLVERLRVIKEPCELLALQKSFAVNHKTVEMLACLVQSYGIYEFTEKNLAWEIEKFFCEHGADELAFATISATGTHTALPHAQPRDVGIAEDSVLLVDLGCRVDNYCSDQTRVWWLGDREPQYFQSAYTLVREAQQKALGRMRAGVACADVYHAAMQIFEKAGQAAHFTHGLGHGVGLQTHEAPSLSPRSTSILESGMVVTVEPGLYYPEWGGVRWENTVVVEENGVRIL